MYILTHFSIIAKISKKISKDQDLKIINKPDLMALHRTITENPIIKEYKLFSSTHITLIKTQNRALTEISTNLKD